MTNTVRAAAALCCLPAVVVAFGSGSCDANSVISVEARVRPGQIASQSPTVLEISIRNDGGAPQIVADGMFEAVATDLGYFVAYLTDPGGATHRVHLPSLGTKEGHGDQAEIAPGEVHVRDFLLYERSVMEEGRRVRLPLFDREGLYRIRISHVGPSGRADSEAEIVVREPNDAERRDSAFIMALNSPRAFYDFEELKIRGPDDVEKVEELAASDSSTIHAMYARSTCAAWHLYSASRALSGSGAARVEFDAIEAHLEKAKGYLDRIERADDHRVLGARKNRLWLQRSLAALERQPGYR